MKVLCCVLFCVVLLCVEGSVEVKRNGTREEIYRMRIGNLAEAVASRDCDFFVSQFSEDVSFSSPYQSKWVNGLKALNDECLDMMKIVRFMRWNFTRFVFEDSGDIAVVSYNNRWIDDNPLSVGSEDGSIWFGFDNNNLIETFIGFTVVNQGNETQVSKVVYDVFEKLSAFECQKAGDMLTETVFSMGNGNAVIGREAVVKQCAQEMKNTLSRGFLLNELYITGNAALGFGNYLSVNVDGTIQENDRYYFAQIEEDFLISILYVLGN